MQNYRHQWASLRDYDSVNRFSATCSWLSNFTWTHQDSQESEKLAEHLLSSRIDRRCWTRWTCRVSFSAKEHASELDLKKNDMIRDIQSLRIHWQQESNAIAEMCSTEITLIPRSSRRRTTFWSEHNSSDDVAFAPVSSEVDERQSIGSLDSSLLT